MELFLTNRLRRVKEPEITDSRNLSPGYPVFVRLLIWVTALLFAGGCASPYVLDPQGNFYIERIPSSWAYLSDIIVDQDGETLVIKGAVRRRNDAFSGTGHIDVAVVSPPGQVINQASAPYEPQILPKTPGARKHRASRFEIRLSAIPPKGSAIRLAFHGRPDPNDTPLYEHKNLAVPDKFDFGG
jgi:hypothetical protein